MLLPDTEFENALQVAEKLRREIERRGIPGHARRLTASFGVAAAPSGGETPQELVATADEALYRAKDRGRNRVEGERETAPTPEGALSIPA